MKTWIFTLIFTLLLSLIVYVKGEAQELDALDWDQPVAELMSGPTSFPLEVLEPKLIEEIRLKDGTILKAKMLPNQKIILQKMGHNGGGG